MTAMNDTNATILPDLGGGFDNLYCGQGFTDFQYSYRGIHGYASLLVCVFGSIANVLNIAVLTRREMVSPTNAILTGLAVADLLVMLEYIPFACHMYLPVGMNRPLTDKYSYGWSFFVLFHSNFGQVCHTISIWLTVTLAVWRYIAIAHPQKNRDWCRMEKTVIAIGSGYIVCPLLCIPIYLSYNIQPFFQLVNDDGQRFSAPASSLGDNSTNDSSVGSHNVTLYRVNHSELSLKCNGLLNDINFWVYSVVIKIIPCIALTVLSLRLICALLETKRRRQNLTMTNISTGSTSGPKEGQDETKKMLKAKKSSRVLDKERQTDRTTRMLLAVLLLFLVTEFPQGILGLLSVTLGKKFFNNCYIRLGEVMDILALINSAINFILYCAMSRQFRTTFNLLFIPKALNRWAVVPQHNGDNNGTTGATTQVTQV